MRNQQSSELHVRRNCFERSLHEREASQEQAFHFRRVAGQHEAELSVRLQQGESLITSMTESFEESRDGLRALADPPLPPRSIDTSTAGIVKSNRFRKKWQEEAKRLAKEMAHLEAHTPARGNSLQKLVAPSDRIEVVESKLTSKFHPKPLSSQYHFHPKPLSSHDHFHPKTSFIPKHFHPQPFSSQNHIHPKSILRTTTNKMTGVLAKTI